jgi:hypothetical protein
MDTVATHATEHYVMPWSHPAPAALLLAIAVRLMPRSHRDFARGMVAELDSIGNRRDRAAFAAGAAWALLRLAVFLPIYRAFHQWTWLAGVGAAVAIGLLDTHAGGTCTLIPLVVTAGVIGGTLDGRHAWQWIAAMTIGLAMSSNVVQGGFLDRTDLLSVTPLLLLATHLGVLARRVMTVAFRSVKTG